MATTMTERETSSGTASAASGSCGQRSSPPARVAPPLPGGNIDFLSCSVVNAFDSLARTETTEKKDTATSDATHIMVGLDIPQSAGTLEQIILPAAPPGGCANPGVVDTQMTSNDDMVQQFLKTVD